MKSLRAARAFAACSFAACALTAPLARAQPMTMERAPVIEPPRLKIDSGVAYPEKALPLQLAQPVTVSLVLEVSEAGLVTQASVVEYRGHGFDEAAVVAAQVWSSSPRRATVGRWHRAFHFATCSTQPARA
jgi:outer membrane biosynthesis protein TonB